MKIFQAVKSFISGGESGAFARATIAKLTKKERDLKPREVKELSHARGITRRIAIRNIFAGTTGTALVTSGIYGVARSFYEETDERIKLLRGHGAEVTSLHGMNGNSENDLFMIAQLHDNPLGEQFLWSEYHELFKILVDLQKNGLINRLYIEGLPIDREVERLPLLDLSNPTVAQKLYSELDSFKTILSMEGKGGKIVKLEVLMKSLFPQMNITGVENPANHKEEYIDYMDNVYQPLLEKLHPFLIALRSESIKNEQIQNADFLIPVYEKNKLVKVKVADKEFNPEELLGLVKEWIVAEKHVDEQSTLREDFLLNNAKNGVLVMGLKHLENLEDRYQGRATGLDHSVHLVYPSKIDKKFFRDADRYLDLMKVSIVEKITAWTLNA